MKRRSFLWLPSLLVATSNSAFAAKRSLNGRLSRWELDYGSRIGVFALDTATHLSFAYDADSRYAMASTFKLLLVAAILRRVDTHKLSLSQELVFTEDQLVTYSPVTSALSKGRITIEQACDAVLRVSDNTAANLLLDCSGGPSAYTRFVRSIGDRVTRLDRREIELNTNIAGDVRDTTTPRAMVNSMRRVLTENILSVSSRTLLTGWLIECSTGHDRIRAGLPNNWRVGDKTGSGVNGAVNDVAIFWPNREQPVLLAIYLSGSTKSTNELNTLHADITRALVDEWFKTQPDSA